MCICIFVLGIRHASRIFSMPYYVAVSGLSGYLLWFTYYLKNGSIFFWGGEGVIRHKLFILISYTTFVQNVSHSKKDSARYGHKCILVFMHSTAEFSGPIFGGDPGMSSSMKIRTGGSELRADRQTDGQP